MEHYTSPLEETMSEDAFIQFTDNLLKSKVLQCSICEELLMTPVRLVEGEGNVCSNCYDEELKNSGRMGFVNSTLDYILAQLILPCKFRSKGCIERFSYNEYANHLSTCMYRMKKCPMVQNLKCRWEGNYNDFMNHFVECHSHCIVKSDNNTFIVPFNFSEAVLLKLVCIKSKIFLLKMTICNDKDKMYYVLCSISDTDNVFDYSVKHRGIEGDTSYIKTKSKLSSSENIYKELDASNSTEINLHALKTVLGISQKIVNVFKLKQLFTNKDELEDKMIQYFECPVCKMFMKPPIYQCNSGHSVCNLCRPRLEKCPTCRASFGSTRNYSLEAITSGVQYPCTYSDLGCTETATASEITKHEVLCSFKPFKCPMSECSLTGSHEVVIKHLNDFHKDKLITTRCHGYSESFRLDQSIYGQVLDRRCLLADDRIFRISCKRSGDYCLWAAELIGSNYESKTYIYEVSIIDKKKSEKKLIRTDYCLNEMNEDELFKKCIMFPNTILSSYSSNGLITFQFSIKLKPS